jgi:hypothetical protein
MAYLGNSPARSFISFERQVFTIVNSQTVYTLDHSVTNENDIRLVVNNIVQEPGSGKAYTATGTTLTLSAALVNGTDEMYCVFLGRATATNAPGAGSVGTAQIADDAVTNAKIADDAISDEQLDPTVITGQTAETSIATDDLILLSDTSASGALRKMTRANFVSGVGETNTPYFRAYNNADFSFTSSLTTKMQMNVVDFESNSGSFDTTNYRFTVPSGEGGKYFIAAILYIYGTGGTDSYAAGYIFKNNSEFLICDNVVRDDFTGSSFVQINALMNLSAGDYIDVRCNASKGSPQLSGDTSNGNSNFYGFKISSS